jgi:predicted nucleic acid-binding protein
VPFAELQIRLLVCCALVIQERFAISFWDALLIHSAEIAEATIFCSEDLSDGQVYGGVRVVNPFNL